MADKLIGLFSLLFMIIVLFALSAYSEEKNIPPVILVNGYGGALVKAKVNKPKADLKYCPQVRDWHYLWLDLIAMIFPDAIECWADEVRLIYDHKSHTTKNSPGVETKIEDFGNTTAVEWLTHAHVFFAEYFHGIVESLLPLGYERGTTLRAAPYDFRKAPNELLEYYRNLRILIEETYQKTGRKVMLVSHSMGSNIILYFLIHQPQHWKDHYIETMVSIGGAWGGSVKSLKMYTEGENFQLPVLNGKVFARPQWTFPALAFLLPSAEVWKSHEVLLQTESMEITTANYKDLFTALNLTNSYDMYLDTKSLLFNTSGPGVELHNLYGVGVATLEKLIFKKGNFPSISEHIFGDGDGTVNRRSSELYMKFQQNQKIYSKAIRGGSHMNLVSGNTTLLYLRRLIGKITNKNQGDGSKIRNLIALEKEKDAFGPVEEASVRWKERRIDDEEKPLSYMNDLDNEFTSTEKFSDVIPSEELVSGDIPGRIIVL